MWISKKKWVAMEKRVADLERELRSQPIPHFIPEDSTGKYDMKGEKMEKPN